MLLHWPRLHVFRDALNNLRRDIFVAFNRSDVRARDGRVATRWFAL